MYIKALNSTPPKYALTELYFYGCLSEGEGDLWIDELGNYICAQEPSLISYWSPDPQDQENAIVEYTYLCESHSHLIYKETEILALIN